MEIFDIPPIKKLWKTAIYIRLSKEDSYKDESLSVKNQRMLLLDYINENNEFDLVDIYIDDGFSGTDSDRPSFQKMLTDIKDKRINCLIVKDLSRLGRNYIEVGNYLEQIFPNLDVRFISLGDNLDSYKSPSGMDSLIVPFKNLINDNYCRESSEKIRKVFDMKRKKGEFIGAFAPYGYVKDKINYNRIVIDEDAADVVRNIFSWFVSGMSKLSITRKLNSLGIPSPSVYKKQKGMKYRCNKDKFGDSLWCTNSVTSILKNEVYIGNMVQGRFKVKSYKVHKQIKQPEDKWFIVKNTHPAIIDKETFIKAQNLQKLNTRISPKNDRVYIFSGLIRCGNCGKAMVRKKSGKYIYYICSTYKNSGGTCCCKNTINHKFLNKILLKVIQDLISLVIYSEENLEKYKSLVYGKENFSPFENSLKLNRKKLEEILFFKKNLYEDWKRNNISEEEYFNMKENYSKDEEKIRSIILNIENLIKKEDNSTLSKNFLLDDLIKYKNISKLYRELLVELVDKIIINNKQEIKIKFKIRDEYKKVGSKDI